MLKEREMFQIKPNKLYGYDTIITINPNDVNEDTNKLYLKDFLKTESTEEIEVDKKMIDSLYLLGKIYFEIAEYVRAKTGMIAKIGHAFRTLKRNQEIGGAAASQHMFCEAMDLHFYKNIKQLDLGRAYVEHNLPLDKREFPQLAEHIYEAFKDKIEQVVFYDWGIHIGIKTVRSKKMLHIANYNKVVNMINT